MPRYFEWPAAIVVDVPIDVSWVALASLTFTGGTGTYSAVVQGSADGGTTWESLVATDRTTQVVTVSGTYVYKLGGFSQLRWHGSTGTPTVVIEMSALTTAPDNYEVGTAGSSYGYLLDDEFDVVEAAGAVNGTPSTDGRSTRTVADTGTNVSIVTHGLRINGGSVSAWNNGLWEGAQRRMIGDVYEYQVLVTASCECSVGISIAASWSSPCGVVFYDGSFIKLANSGSTVGTMAAGMYQVRIEVLTAGYRIWLKGGAWQQWTSVGIDGSTRTDLLIYPFCAVYQAAGGAAYFSYIRRVSGDSVSPVAQPSRIVTVPTASRTYRTAVAAADFLAAPSVVGTAAANNGGTLANLTTFHVNVVAANAYGETTATVPADIATSSPNLTGRIQITPVAGLLYHIYFSTDAAPLWLNVVTAANITNGCKITAVGNGTLGYGVTEAGGVAGRVDVCVAGTGLAAAITAAVNHAWNPEAITTAIDCSGYGTCRIKALCVYNARLVAPALRVVPVFYDATSGKYHQGSEYALTFGGASGVFSGLCQDLTIDCAGNNALHVLVQYMAGLTSVDLSYQLVP